MFTACVIKNRRSYKQAASSVLCYIVASGLLIILLYFILILTSIFATLPSARCASAANAVGSDIDIIHRISDSIYDLQFLIFLYFH